MAFRDWFCRPSTKPDLEYLARVQHHFHRPQRDLSALERQAAHADDLINLVHETTSIASDVARKFETEVNKAQRRVSLIFNTITDAAVMVDTTGRVLALNPSAELLFGTVEGPVVNLLADVEAHKNVISVESRRFRHYVERMLSGKDSPDLLREAYRSYAACGRARFVGRSHLVKAKNADGLDFDFEFSAHLLNPEEQADDWIYIIVGRDVTLKNKQLRELHELQQLQEAILKSVPLPMFFTSGDYRIQWSNQLFDALFGDRRTQDCREVFPSLRDVWQSCRGGSISSTLDSHLGVRQFIVNQARVCNNDDKCDRTCGFVCTLVDVTDLESHKTKLAEQERDLQAIIDNLQDIVFVVQGTQVLRRNFAATRYLASPDFRNTYARTWVTPEMPVWRQRFEDVDGDRSVMREVVQVALDDLRAMTMIETLPVAQVGGIHATVDAASYMFVVNVDGQFEYKSPDLATLCEAENIAQAFKQLAPGVVEVSGLRAEIKLIRAASHFVGFLHALPT